MRNYKFEGNKKCKKICKDRFKDGLHKPTLLTADYKLNKQTKKEQIKPNNGPVMNTQTNEVAGWRFGSS